MLIKIFIKILTFSFKKRNVSLKLKINKINKNYKKFKNIK